MSVEDLASSGIAGLDDVSCGGLPRGRMYLVVAIIDIGLPGLDGYELARRVRSELGDAIRLVAITGYGQPEDRRRTREAGFDVHLVKPTAPDEVLASLVGDGARTAESR